MAGASDRPGEFELIARYFAPLARRFPGAFDLLDDAATLSVEPGHELVVTTDAVVADVHFLADDPPESVGRKALRVNLSDLAAKGARPIAYLLDAVFNKDVEEPWIAGFAAGLGEDQDEFDIALIGGDTAATPGPTTLAITALGLVRAGTMLRRSHGRPGDDIYVSGTIGDGALGLDVRRGALADLSSAARAHLEDRYRRPQPRVVLGPALIGIARASIDISDGLIADLGHVVRASKCRATVDVSRLPLSAAARQALHLAPSALARILGGGDDYEVLFTAPPEAADRLARLAAGLSLPLTPIGTLTEGEGVSIRDQDGREIPLEHVGWQHF